MKYIIRAVKYFLYVSVLLAVVMSVMIATGFVQADLALMFKDGYDSFGKIALMFAAVSAVYPYFGYMKRDIAVAGEDKDLRPQIIAMMEEKGYVLEKNEEDVFTFRSRSVVSRVLRTWEDRITFTKQFGGYSAEGLRREVVRVAGRIEYKLRTGEDY